MNGLAKCETLKIKVSLHDMPDQLGRAQRGRSMQCPNQGAHQHGDQTMAAHVSPSERTRHRYACGAGGSVIDLFALSRGISIGSSLFHVGRANFSLPAMR